MIHQERWRDETIGQVSILASKVLQSSRLFSLCHFIYVVFLSYSKRVRKQMLSQYF